MFDLMPVPAPAGGILFFARPKKSIQKKSRPAAACFLRSSISPGVAERGSCPFGNVRHPCRTPEGLIPAKAPVLGAADGIGFGNGIGTSGTG
jgi:hypothetical protein